MHTCPAHHSQRGYHEVPLGQIFLRFFAAAQNRTQNLNIFKETPCRWRNGKIWTILPGIDHRALLPILGYCLIPEAYFKPSFEFAIHTVNFTVSNVKNSNGTSGCSWSPNSTDLYFWFVCNQTNTKDIAGQSASLGALWHCYLCLCHACSTLFSATVVDQFLQWRLHVPHFPYFLHCPHCL